MVSSRLQKYCYKMKQESSGRRPGLAQDLPEQMKKCGRTEKECLLKA